MNPLHDGTQPADSVPHQVGVDFVWWMNRIRHRGLQDVWLRTPRHALLGLLLLLVAVAPTTSRASDLELVSWDALAPSVIVENEPLRGLSIAQKSDLQGILQARQAQREGREDAALRDAAEAARQRLVADGVDIERHLETMLAGTETRWEDAIRVTPTHLDREVLIDGYVLPLKWKWGRAVEFFLVPWVGACIHTPSPPPNQVIHVAYPRGLALEGHFDAVRLSGTLRHEMAERTLFLIDGSRPVLASYALTGAAVAGTPGEIVAASAAEVPAMVRTQIWINELFTSSMAAVGEGGSPRALLMALLLAFAYGALHTLGPGHGKSVVVSYFIGTGGSLRRGLTMGARIAVFHVLSAVAIVFLFDFTVRQATGAAPSDYRAIRLASYALIVLIGAVMLWQAVSALRASRSQASEDSQVHGHAHHGHDHAHRAHQHPHHDHSGCAACAAGAAPTGSGWVAAAVGVVPCTGALLVLLFGLANDLIWPAILMVVAISIGMAVAMSAIGVAALLGRNWAERRFAAGSNRRLHFELGARLAGSACVLLIGAILFGLTLAYQPTVAPLANDVAMRADYLAETDG